MSPIDHLLRLLPAAKQVGNGWTAQCPAHEDRRPSLSIKQSDTGKILLKCFAGCSYESILSALGTSSAELHGHTAKLMKEGSPMSNRQQPKRFDTLKDAIQSIERHNGKVIKIWEYRDREGTVIGAVARWNKADGKDFRPISLKSGKWLIEAMTPQRPLYNLPDLAEACRVIVVEGEKAADAATGLGFISTTSAGGSHSVRQTDWKPLAGKDVWILPDNDEPGQKYASTIIEILERLTPSPKVRVITLPGLPEKGDIVDWIEAHGDAAEPSGMREEIEGFAASTEVFNAQTEAESLRFVPFPVHTLPEPIRSFVESASKAIGCDPCYFALPLLTVMGSAIGNTRRLQLKRSWNVPPVLWTVMVGESGNQKSPAFKLVTRPIEECQAMAFKENKEAVKKYNIDFMKWDAEHTKWKRNKGGPSGEPPVKPEPPKARRYFVSDTTVEAIAPILADNPRGILLSRDELAGWFGSFDRYAGKAGADSANWLSMYNCGTIVVDRKTGIPPTLHVPHACVSVLGGIQPKILKRALGEEHRESGLAARLLLACPPRKSKKWTEADIDPEIEEQISSVFKRLHELDPAEDEAGNMKPINIKLSMEAKRIWIAYYDTHAIEQVELVGDLAASWSKLEEYAARIALVIHFVRWAANDPTLMDYRVLDETSLRSGIEMTTWCKGEIKRVYQMLMESDEETDDRRLLEWIERKGGTVTTRETQQSCAWLKASSETAEAALESLVQSGKGEWVTRQPSGSGGRPTRYFSLKP